MRWFGFGRRSIYGSSYLYLRMGCIRARGTINVSEFGTNLTWYFTCFGASYGFERIPPTERRAVMPYPEKRELGEIRTKRLSRWRANEFFPSNVCESFSSLPVPASCCGVGVEDSNVPDASGPTGAGGTGGGVAVIPDRPPLELDKLPPYHDVAPSPGECYYDACFDALIHMRTRRRERSLRNGCSLLACCRHVTCIAIANAVAPSLTAHLISFAEESRAYKTGFHNLFSTFSTSR